MINAYVETAEADAYHEARPSHEQWQALDEKAKKRALVAASDYLDVNYPLKDGLNDRMRNGEAVPSAVVRAVCELALHAGELTADKTADKASVSVGEISVSYRELSGIDAKRFSYVAKMLDGLIEKQRGSARLVRG
ncbi:hypothetical protein KRX19_05575 [Cardiobacteriaceae bacterium TAE3-ERU3]|nr:hypothetical protein [Cardiobacteriaceae bacterium TAE3-ERU3]